MKELNANEEKPELTGKKFFFEARNEYELLVSIIFSYELYRNKGVMSCILNSSELFINNCVNKDLFNWIVFIEPRLLNNRFSKYLYLFYQYLFKKKEIKSVYVFHEVSPILFMKNNDFDICMIEHGMINYTELGKNNNINSLYLRLKKILKQRYVGETSRIKEIYFKNIENVPFALKHKAKRFELIDSYQGLSGMDKHKINKIFDINVSLELIKQDIRFCNLIITQPFSELKMMTEDEKVGMYKSYIPVEGAIIKPHPREKTQYKKLFKNCLVLSGKTPMELFYLNGIVFDTVVTVNSSAIDLIRYNKLVTINLNGVN